MLKHIVGLLPGGTTAKVAVAAVALGGIGSAAVVGTTMLAGALGGPGPAAGGPVLATAPPSSAAPAMVPPTELPTLAAPSTTAATASASITATPSSPSAAAVGQPLSPASTGQPSAQPATGPARRAGLPVHGVLDYQLGGAYPPDPAVQIVDRDSTAPAAPGRYNICYVNAFQTQPGDGARWSQQHPELLLHAADGSLLTDPDWPDEYLFDTSTPASRTQLAALLASALDRCASAGYQAVEADNLDSYSRSQDRLTPQNNLALAATLIAHAHARGLAIGQKNAAELTGQAHALGFDFAVTEECQVHAECAAYTDSYGDGVLEIEYTDNDQQAFIQACQQRGQRISVILRDRQVLPRGNPAYVYRRCS